MYWAAHPLPKNSISHPPQPPHEQARTDTEADKTARLGATTGLLHCEERKIKDNSVNDFSDEE